MSCLLQLPSEPGVAGLVALTTWGLLCPAQFFTQTSNFHQGTGTHFTHIHKDGNETFILSEDKMYSELGNPSNFLLPPPGGGKK